MSALVISETYEKSTWEIKIENKRTWWKNKMRKDLNDDGVKKKRSTDAVIDKLQNYFGIALRSNIGNLKKKTQDAILASVSHVASSKEEYYVYCPKTPDTWGHCNRNQQNRTDLCKSGPGISVHVINVIKPIYADLTREDILPKCLHGLTQNHIWWILTH